MINIRAFMHTAGYQLPDLVPENDAKKKKTNWIAGAIKKPGALHRQLGIPAGKKIPASLLRTAAKKGGKLGARARLALTLKKLKKRRKK
jgi:hypothetical protein